MSSMFRVISYNLLVPEFAKPDYFTSTKPEYLDIDYRWGLFEREFERELKFGNSKNILTIFCFQEVCLIWHSKLTTFFHNRGYHLISDLYGKYYSDYMGVATAVPHNCILKNSSIVKIGDKLRSVSSKKVAVVVGANVGANAGANTSANAIANASANVSANASANASANIGANNNGSTNEVNNGANDRVTNNGATNLTTIYQNVGLMGSYLNTYVKTLVEHPVVNQVKKIVTDNVQQQIQKYANNTSITRVDNLNPSSNDQAVYDAWEVSMNKANSLIFVHLQLDNNKQICVGNYHMPCDFKRLDVMIIHASFVKDTMFELSGGNSFVLAGDFNIKPHDIMYPMLTQGIDCTYILKASNGYDVRWKPNYRNVLKSAYFEKNRVEPKFTNYATTKNVSSFCETLDYIFYWNANVGSNGDGNVGNNNVINNVDNNGANLNVIGVLELQNEINGDCASFPDKTHPSDHIMIGAIFSL